MTSADVKAGGGGVLVTIEACLKNGEGSIAYFQPFLHELSILCGKIFAPFSVLKLLLGFPLKPAENQCFLQCLLVRSPKFLKGGFIFDMKK